MALGKLNISRLVYKNTGKAIPQGVIIDIITIVCNYIIDEISENRSVSIENFGTFSVRSSYGLKFTKQPKKILLFKLHTTFSKMWYVKKNRFRKSKKFKKKVIFPKLSKKKS